jgi:signal transduction histidine kinase
MHSDASHPSDVSEQIGAAVGKFRVLTPGILAGFFVIVLVLIATLIVGLANLRNVYSASEAVARTYLVKVALSELLLAAVDAETGERGFIITGEAEYLDPYDRAREVVVADISRVGALVADNPEQRADLDRLSAVTEVKLHELAEAVRQRREMGFAAAQAIVTTNVGMRTMDRMREIVARMETREDTLLAVRTADAAQNYRTAASTRIVTTAAAILAVVALFLGTLRYGAHRLRAERAARTQEAQLRETLQLKDEFVALVSHELRTPANTIAGWTRMLQQGAVSPDRAANAIAAITRNAESLRQLLDDLLDTSQLVSGRMRLAIGMVDLASVVQEAMDAVRLSADNKGVILTSELPAGVPLMMRGDAGRLKQVVWNLLANAIKFTPAGGHVTVSIALFDRGTRLDVRDSGEGIDPAFLPHIFERFRQAASTGAQRGLGLGLAIVRHLVELHGGTISAYSEGPGKGATFVIEWPTMTAAETVTGPAWSEIDRA